MCACLCVYVYTHKHIYFMSDTVTCLSEYFFLFISRHYLLQNDKSTPLHLACTQGALEVVKLMLGSFDQVEDIINITDGACQTPLHRWAISGGS